MIEKLNNQSGKSQAVGSLLAQKFDVLEDFDELASDIQSQSGQIDGSNVASGIIASASAVAKLPVALAVGNDIRKREFFLNVHAAFLSNFEAIESLDRKKPKAEYSVTGKCLGEIYLVNKPDRQELRIGSNYYAFIENEEFKEKRNSLTAKELAVIAGLPSSKEEVIRNYAGKVLAEHLYEEFKSKKSQENIVWKYKAGKNEKRYEFGFFAAQPESTAIKGTNENNSLIFEAEVSKNGSIEIKKNKISIGQLKEFAVWNNIRLNRLHHHQSQSPKHRVNRL